MKQLKFPAQNARASLKLDDLRRNMKTGEGISRAKCAGLIEVGSASTAGSSGMKFPAQNARASLKFQVRRENHLILLQFPAQNARASLKCQQHLRRNAGRLGNFPRKMRGPH